MDDFSQYEVKDNSATGTTGANPAGADDFSQYEAKQPDINKAQAGLMNSTALLQTMNTPDSLFGTSTRFFGPGTEKRPGLLDGISNYLGSVGRQIKGGLSSIKEGFRQIGQSQEQGVANTPIDMLEGGMKEIGGVGAVLTSPFAPVAEGIGGALDIAANKISDSKAVQKFAESSAGKATSKVAEDVGLTAGALGTIAGLEEISPRVGAKVKDIQTKATEAAVKSEKDAWERPAKSVKPMYKNAGEIFKSSSGRNANIPDVLVKNNIKLADNIENGMYNTNASAETIRGDAVKMSRELLRPALENADVYDPIRVPVKDVINEVRSGIMNDKSITAGDKKTIIARLEAEGVALQEANPKGFSRTGILDEQQVRDLNAKYSTTGDISTNQNASMNKAIADVMRKKLRSTAPEGIPIDAFQKELSKQLQAANYLDSLHGKKVPQTIVQKIVGTASKVTGAAIGHGVGGGVLGTVGGYHLGGMLESMLENIPENMRGSLIENLKKTNPEAYKAMRAYVPQEGFMLPAPSGEPAVGGVFHVGPERKTTFEPAAQRQGMSRMLSQEQLKLPAPRGDGFIMR